MGENVRADQQSDESAAIEPREILYLTTNDVTNPARGCDRRSHQIEKWLGRWDSLHSISYAKSSEKHSTTSGDRTVLPYPSAEFLAPLNARYLLCVLLLWRRSFDWVFVSGLGGVLYGLVARYLFGARLIVDFHNAEHVLSKELRELPRYLFAISAGRIATESADVVVLASALDREQYREAVRHKSVVLNNGYDSDIFYPTDEQRDGILFFGNMNYGPNVEAVRYIADELGPELERAGLDTDILIAGPHCDEIQKDVGRSSPVTVAGFVDDIAALVRRAEVVIVPLEKGGGTRLKIIESLACGTPVVATPKGAEGWPSDWKNLHVVEKDGFTEAVLSFVRSPIGFEKEELEEYSRYAWRRQVRSVREELD